MSGVCPAVINNAKDGAIPASEERVIALCNVLETTLDYLPGVREEPKNMTAPTFEAKSFICPWCHVHATMDWTYLHTNWSPYNTGLNLAICANCSKYSIWKEDNGDESVMIYPLTPSAPRSNPDMPDDVEELYCEAANISIFSHRGAAAILRLCLEKLCNELTNKEDTIDHNLKRLAESDDPIPGRMLKMAHFVRVMGNEAVHPGKIDFNDNPEIVKALFTFINLLVDNQITQLKRLDSLIQAQPPDVQKKIMKHENRP